jgi:uroporphyrinogen decarboxylase
MSVTFRDRWISTVEFKPADRPFRWESMGFWDETITRWHGEGLPKEVDTGDKLYMFNNFDYQAPVLFFPDKHPGLYPLFEEKIIAEDDRVITKIDITGAVVRVPKDGHSTLPSIVDPPVKDKESWEAIKPRLDPASRGRIDEWEWSIQIAAEQSWPLFVYFCGLFGTLRHLFGVEPLMYAYYDQPELIHEISKHWVYLWKSVFTQIAEKHRPDFAYVWEDMSGKNGPLIGPTMFEYFMSPYYRELIGFLKHDLGIPVVGVDSDGDITLLIPKFVDAGINLLFPFEVQAGMDVLKIRREWPTQFAIWGGIDKRALAKDRKAIEAEVLRVLPPMLKMGGYIPGIDHAVPPDVPYDNWIFFRDMVRDMADKFHGIS